MFYYIILLLIIIQPSYQVTYPCNSSDVCGCSQNSVSATRIVGGESASTATWSWAVSIKIGSGTLCGGTIISSLWILTAAHCVSGKTASQFTIYAGSTSRWSGTQTRSVSQIFSHPSYNPSTYVNDLALLQLASPLSMSDPYVSRICVPSVSSTTLASGEWPPVGTYVSVFIISTLIIICLIIGHSGWMG